MGLNKTSYLTLRLIPVLLLIGIVSACRPRISRSPITSLKPLQASLPQDSTVQVYFNQAQTAVYTEPYRQQTRPGDNLEQIIAETILGADATVDVAVQELRLPGIAAAMVQQHQAGVKVRLILEHTYSRPWSSFSTTATARLPERDRQQYDEFVQLADMNQDGQLSQAEINQRDALVMIFNAGIPWIDDTADGSKGSGLMHHKFVVVDGRTVVVTSANFTTSDVHGDFANPDSRGNVNNLIKLESPSLAVLFTQEFNLMWGDGPGGQTDSLFGTQKPYREPQAVTVGNTQVTVQFSPTARTQPWSGSSNGLINQVLAGSQGSVDFALFVFSAQELVNTLEQRSQAQVTIQGLIDPNFAYRDYSEALDMAGIAAPNQCKYEAGNRPWAKPISTVGVPSLPPGDKLHHKFGLVDDAIVIAGSHNWTEAANTLNDETVLVIKNPTVAAHFHQEFERLYQDARLGIPESVREKFNVELKTCGNSIVAPPAPLQIDPTQRINLNRATLAELESLPGIGPKLAQQIVTTRQQQPFTSLADLQRVPGVGPKLIEQLKDFVVVQ
ncbi:MAG: competence protein ComE [Oscillatoriales cyanobacterium RM2_1_1]|nr:competence protein ComE [Oscillatoriales cyanobacterium SM2_3_0]NJO46074.1 competence protein ComE [Oscillatoriales cyanobacterium RM2_1_1]